MLEKLLNLKQAMKENKGKGFVYEKFQDYFFWYESLEHRTIKDKIEFREAELEYNIFMGTVELDHEEEHLLYDFRWIADKEEREKARIEGIIKYFKRKGVEDIDQ